MAELFRFSDEPWAVIGPFMPTSQPGARREHDRRIISDIVHVLHSGCRWRDCQSDYGAHTTVYNRFNRWSSRGLWCATLTALADSVWVAETAALASTYVRADRSAHGAKELLARKPLGARAAVNRPRSTSLPTSLDNLR